MTLFISMAALLVLLTLLLLARPLWSTRRQEGNGAEPAEIAAIRRQLAELAGLHKEGVLGEAQYAQARAGLERRLVDAVLGGPAPAPTTSAKPTSMRLAIVLSVFVVALAGAGYYMLGTPRALNPAATETASTAPGADGHSVGAEQIEKMVANLATRLKTTPDDADGWAMLGRSYAALGRHDQAAQSLKQAMALRPGDAVVIADYADALAASSDRNLEGEPAQLVAKALAIDPDNVKALSLAGTVAFNRKDYAGALRHWERMLKIAPDSEFSRQIQGGIDEARSLLSGQRPTPMQAAATPAAGPAASKASAASVSGVVSLAATLAGKAS
ncbi:MAG: c-type cytochrome biogenesis protein CcmI, partial [Rhizobacter sp.]|nr:c-type cytochrome biogenesis protein CcmI [Rhizobacter sp.]